MLSEALKLYVELDLLVHDKMGELERFGGTDDGDVDRPLLDTERKDYRKLIHRSEVSRLDLQRYTFARQARLLLRMDEAGEMMRRSIAFVRTMQRQMAEARDELPELFAECWAYSALESVSHELAEHLPPTDAAFGELRAIACDVLKRLDGAVGMDAERIAKSAAGRMQQSTIADALRNRAAFDEFSSRRRWRRPANSTTPIARARRCACAWRSRPRCCAASRTTSAA